MEKLKLLCVSVIIAILHFPVSNGIIEEEELQLGVFGDAASSDTRNHNRKVVCVIDHHWIMEETGQMDALLCTHFLFREFEVNATSYQISFRLSHDNPEPWLTKLNKLRKRNPHLKLLLHIYDVEHIPLIVKEQRKRNIFFASVYKFLRHNSIDGICLSSVTAWKTDYSLYPQFTCRLHEYIRKGNMKIGFWLPGNVEQLSKLDIKSLNPCVDFFLIYSKKDAYPREFTHHAYPLHQLPEDHSYPNFQQLVETVLGYKIPGEKIVMTISPEGNAFTLIGNEVNKTTLDCCGTGRPATGGAEFPELGNQGYILNYQVCKLFRNSTWQIFRSESPGKEVFATDRKRWVSFEDNVSLQAKVNFTAELNISFVIWTIPEDNSNPQPCQEGTDRTGFSYPFLRNVNHLLHQRLQEKREYTDDKAKSVAPDFSIDETSNACYLTAELRKAAIAKSEHHIWLCMAYLETKFNPFFENFSNPTTDIAGCSTARYGIFGLYSPICGNAQSIRGNNLCTPSICGDSCEDLAHGNISANIQCLLKAARSSEGLYPASFLYCSDPTKEKFGFDTTKCVEKGRLDRMTSTVSPNKNISDSATQPDSTNSTVIIVSGVTLLIVLAVAICGFVLNKRKSQASKLTALEISAFKNGTKGDKSAGKDGKEVVDDVNSAPYDKGFEVALSDYRIYSNSVLGSGQFGIVYKALALNRNCAVKTLKPFAEKEYLLALLAEIKIMTYLGKHENIVEFVGSCTQLLSSNIVYLFVEFCELGSLENYLRVNRNEYSDNAGFGNDCALSRLDLVQWSYQIANGMAHLASKGVIHGDLSAKNVLLTADRIAKVSDFGLSRKLYTYTSYIKQKQEPLPWRWMSIEALRELKFSTESDVWSFGVTLWEIFSLGNIPYPGQNYTFDFVDKLVEEGLRLPKPQLADTFLFENIITPTWNEIAEKRPSFANLKELLQNILRQQFHDYTVLNEHCSNQEAFERYSVLSYN